MSVPLMALSNGCCGTLKKLPPSTSSKLVAISTIFDALLSITCLVMGILGVTSTVAMPLSAAYALIGVSGGVVLLWIAMIIKAKCCSPQQPRAQVKTISKK